MGAFGSPQLLLASGIGAREELEKVGIEAIREVKGVGKGLKVISATLGRTESGLLT